MELIFELIAEVLLQGGVHLLGDVGANLVASYRRRGPSSGFLAALGHIFFGAACGGLSLLLFAKSFAHTDAMRLVALFGSPLLAGLISALIGTRRRDAGRTSVLFETFLYGFLFAFSFAVVRYFFATV